MFILPLYFCICFLLTKETFASFIPLNKRQAIPSRICGEQNNTVAICSPSTDSIWYNGTENEVIWKYNNPKFGQYSTLDLYLLYINSTTDYYDTIKNWTGLAKSAGTTVVEVDDTWFPAEFGSNTNVTLTAYMYLVGAGYDIYSDLELISTEHNYFPAPLPFTIIRVVPNTTNTSLPTTTAASPTPTDTNSPSSDEINENQPKKLAGWAIAVIVIAIVLFLLALVALIWAYKRYKNKKQLNLGVSKSASHGDDEKIPVLTPNKNESNVVLPVAGAVLAKGDIASINSSTQQLWSPRSLSPRHDEISFITTSEKPGQHQQPLGLHSEANQSSSILSSTDALMIADTFRQFMRKPDWNEELELNEQNKKSKKEDD